MWRGAVLVALCSLAAIHAAEIGNADKKYDAIVVGVGAAGAAALRRLAGGGRRVLALEAAGRVGGRVNTTRFGAGRVELGAEWIHGQNGSRTYQMALDNGVPMAYQHLVLRHLFSNGSDVGEALAVAIKHCLDQTHAADKQGLENELQVYEKICTEYMGAHHPDLLRDSAFFRAFMRYLDLYMVSADAATSTADLATDDEYQDLDEKITTSWAGVGYKTLFEILLNTYNSGPGLEGVELRLNAPVSRVAWGEAGCVVTAAAETYAADHCVVTVSLGVLKAMHTTLFFPPLPQDKVDAIETLAMGVLDKVIFSFADIWWQRNLTYMGLVWLEADERAVPEADKWTTKIAGLSASMGSENVLEFWFSGDVGKHVETLPDEEVKTKLVAVLRKFLGDKVPEPTGMIRSYWHTSPLTRGSYSYDAAGRAAGAGGRARAALATPLAVARLQLAGEHTHRTRHSTVHGAVETGERAADLILGVKS